jgi:L,D-peptidoglycan transpeptidase YkuD (ErfK/YbiS/YcfS/YnhG family)
MIFGNRTMKMKKISAVILSVCAMFAMSGTSYAAVIKNTMASVSPGPTAGSSYSNARIYVSKRNHVLSLYEGGSVTGEWPCNVGTYSADGDKKTEGDSTTPSGRFYVCTRNDQSICYKAFGVSYPSTDDAQRGLDSGLITLDQFDEIRSAIARRQQPLWNTPLGGFIEIHGGYEEGGTTHGCVAVDNSVMDILWDKCPMGTTIEIGP